MYAFLRTGRYVTVPLPSLFSPPLPLPLNFFRVPAFFGSIPHYYRTAPVFYPSFYVLILRRLFSSPPVRTPHPQPTAGSTDPIFHRRPPPHPRTPPHRPGARHPPKTPTRGFQAPSPTPTPPRLQPWLRVSGRTISGGTGTSVVLAVVVVGLAGAQGVRSEADGSSEGGRRGEIFWGFERCPSVCR